MYCRRKSNNIRIHERALRIAYNDYLSDFNSLLVKDDSVTIHRRNIQAYLEIYKTLNNLNTQFMKEVFCLKQQNYSLRNGNLTYPNPRTVSYGLETFGYKDVNYGIICLRKYNVRIYPFLKNMLLNTAKILVNATYISANLGYIKSNPINN